MELGAKRLDVVMELESFCFALESAQGGSDKVCLGSMPSDLSD